MNKERIGEFDLLKGLGILAMIAGHRLESMETAVAWIHTFHMPLFVIISGYLFRERSLTDFLRRSSKRLLLPLAVVLLVAGLFDDPSGQFREAVLRSDPPLWVVWFLPALFVVQLESNWLLRRWWGVLTGLLLAVAAALFYGRVPLPLCLWQGLFMFPFFALGHACARYGWLTLLQGRRQEVRLFVAATLVWLLAFACQSSVLRLAVCQPSLWLVGDVVMSAAACLSLFLLCRWLMLSGWAPLCVRALRWLGVMSMVILCLHAIDHHILVGFPWVGAYWNHTQCLGDHAWGVGYLTLEIPLLILLAHGVARVKPLRYVFGLE